MNLVTQNSVDMDTLTRIQAFIQKASAPNVCTVDCTSSVRCEALDTFVCTLQNTSGRFPEETNHTLTADIQHIQTKDERIASVQNLWHLTNVRLREIFSSTHFNVGLITMTAFDENSVRVCSTEAEKVRRSSSNEDAWSTGIC